MQGISVSGVNYLAVIVCGIGAFMIGGAWYTALFGKAWLAAQNLSEEQTKQLTAQRSPAAFFGGLLVSYVVIAWVLAVLLTSFGVHSAGLGAGVGFLIWLGPAAATYFTGHLASHHHASGFAIDASFQLLFLVGMGAVLGAWQ